MEKTLWYIWSIEHTAWWCPKSKGYTGNIEGAGLYSYKEACEIVHGANYTLRSQGGRTLPHEAMIFAKHADA